MTRSLKLSALLSALACLAALAPAPAAAQSIGRVLVAVGDVALVRSARVVPAVNGTPVEVGDQVRTGPGSTAQIRFTDSAIISVKPQSLFAVSEYAFNGAEDGTEKAVFNLVRGGFRTVTGLIGHINKRSYEVRTSTSTIGIRGTVWGAQQCEAGQCKQPDGTDAPAGTYGEVKSGAIGVTNQVSDTEFGPNSAFYVADANTPAVRLLFTPEFVLDRLDSRSRNTGKSGSESSSVNLAAAGDGRITPVTTTYTPLTYVASDSRNKDGSSAVLTSVSSFTGFAAIYTIGAGAFDGVSSCTNGSCNSNEATTFSFNGDQLVSYSGAASGAKLTSGGTLANLQTLTLGNGDLIVLGQLTGNYAGTANGGSAFSGPNAFVFGATNSPLVNISSPLPASGSFSFGGTPGSFVLLAVDAAGNTTTSGTVSGSYNAPSRSVSFGGSINFASIASFGAAGFTVSGGGTIPGGSNSLNNASVTWSCSGAGCQSAGGSGNFDARFLHSSTNIPGMLVDGGLVNATKNGSSGNTVVFGAGLKCVSGAC